MGPFFVTAYPLVGVTITILGLGITLYLLHVEAKAKATWLWTGFFSSFALAGLTMILASALWPPAGLLVPVQDAFFVLGGVFLVQFAVHFPRRDEPFGARVVVVLSTCIGLVAVGRCAFVLYRLLAGTDVSIQATGASRWFIPLGTLGALWVLFSRAAHFALVDGPQKSGWLARPGSVLRCLVRPPNRDSLALRDFGLALCFGLVPGIILLLPLNIQWSYPAGVGILLTMAGMMLVYLNHAPRPTTFIVKLAGISLVTLLVLFDLFGMESLADTRDQVRRNLELEALWALQAAGAGGPMATPSAVVSIVALPQGPVGSGDGDLLYLRDDQPPPDLVALVAETEYLASLPTVVELGKSLPGRWLGYDRFLLDAEGQEYIVDFHLRAAVLPIHRRVVTLIVQALLGSLFIVAVFPLFFRYNLVRPLDHLLAGVRQANDGDLNVDVPVQFEDEIGFLTRSFNAMVRSLRQSDRRKDELNAALQRANAELERRVVERTADLTASEARYRELFETMTNTGDVIWMFDLASSRFAYVSPSVERLRGYTPEEVMAQPLEASLTPESYQLISEDLAQRLAAFQAGDESMRVRTHRVDQPCKDGSVVPTEVVTTMIIDDQGRATQILGVSRDITQQRRVENALRQAKETADEARIAAEASSRAKSIFLANMSHELRTPLNAILGFSQIMAADANLTPDQQENLRLINRSGAHLLAIINDVLELSEVEAGHADLYPTDFDLHRMLQGLEDTFRLAAREKGLDLALERGPHVPRYVHADQNKLRQVLTNLLSNAVKYTATGRIDVRLHARAPANAEHPGELELHFEVEDTGVGMTPEALETLFVPFVQADSRRQVREGAGLGVPLSHAFVQMMGGELTVRSQPGRGTLFRFHVVVEAVGGLDAGVPRPEPGAAQPESEPYRLLIAEDMEANRELLVAILKPLGLELRTAADGRQALDVWQAWRPHLILMDVRMPVMDGLETTRLIKAMPRGRETVVVALTAHTTPRDRKAMEEAGCDDFLPKPLRQEALFDTLRRHLGLSHGPGASAEPGMGLQADVPQQVALPLDLDVLPAPWPAKLRRAAVDADLDRLLYLIDQIQEIDVSLAGTLRDWAHRFDYDTILAWLDRLESASGPDGERDAEHPG